MPPKAAKKTQRPAAARPTDEEDTEAIDSDTTEVVTLEDSPPQPPPKQGPQPPPKPQKKTTPPMASTTTVGILRPFDSSVDDYEIWEGTFQSFLEANGLDPTDSSDKKKCHGIFLSGIGIKNYALLTTLSAPDALSSKSLKELKALMKAHFKPSPKAIAERFKVTGRKQRQGESVTQFLAALRELAVNCKFTSDLTTRLRDQFIFGLASERMQRSLLAKDDDVKLEDVLQICTAM